MTKNKHNLHDKLKAVADEYARQFSKVTGYELQYWVGEDVCLDTADFGDIYFFSLSDMQIVIDHLPQWVERYGSVEKVGSERYYFSDDFDYIGGWEYIDEIDRAYTLVEIDRKSFNSRNGKIL